jgi:HAD superfamily hydrolase (TIGR01549 family)
MLMPLALFDLDNTLADRTGAFQRWVAAFAAHFDVPDEVASWLVELDGDGFVPRPEFLVAVRERLRLAPTVHELLAWYDATYPAHYVREEESVAALERLRGDGWSVAVVTNGRTVQQMEKMRRTGLDQVVDAVCVSEALRVRKPDPRIFTEAARRCETQLDGWMVGDSPVADIGGGKAVGLRTAWLARGRQWDEGPRPDLVVGSVSEAVAHLLGDAP